MNCWEKRLSPGLRKVEDLFNYLTECKNKEEKPLIPSRFPEESIKKMYEYYRKHPDASERKDRTALRKIQSGTEIPEFFIPYIRKHFKKQIELEKAIKEIEQKLPKKKKLSSVAAYSQPEKFTLRNPRFGKTKFQGEYTGILMYYNPSALENPPEAHRDKISKFGFAFELFYDINRTTKNHSLPQEKTDSGYELITIPEENPKMIVYFNTIRNNMWFAHKKNNREAKRIINDFIKKVRENQV